MPFYSWNFYFDKSKSNKIKRMGVIWCFSYIFSSFVIVFQRYQSEAKIEQVDGFAMVKEMAEEMENMMGDKIEAIKVKLN